MGQQQRLASDDKQLVNLGRVLQTLREEDNVDVLIETILNYIRTELVYDLVWVGFYDRLDHRLLGKGGITPNGDTSFLKQRFFLSPGDLLEQVVIQQRPIGVPDLREANRAGEWRKVAQSFNIQGTLMFPIRYRDRCFGVVLLGSRQWGISPRPEEKARLSMLLGGLGAALNQIETDWQHQQTKRPDEPLLILLEHLRSLPSLIQRLEVVVTETHKFISPTRTNIYWFEPERRYFWRRVGNRVTAGNFGDAQSVSAGITVQEAGGFYKAMVADQIVSIGEAHSSLKADITSRLLQRLGVRSLLAAPILLRDELLGFLAVEGSDPRIWKEEEKSYVRGAAQLVALVAPIEEMETVMYQTQQDAALRVEVAEAITSEEDWQTRLKTCAEHLQNRLQAQRFMVLLFDRNQNQFEICYQSQPPNRRSLGEQAPVREAANSTPAVPLSRLRSEERKNRVLESTEKIPSQAVFPTLSQVDWQWLERSTDVVEVEDLSTDLKLIAWREGLLEASVRSLLLCNTTLGKPLEGLVVLAWETPRTWVPAEREIVCGVSQQIGLILHQWHLQREVDQQQKVFQSLQLGLSTVHSAQHLIKDRDGFDPHSYERAILQPIAQLLGCPLVILVTWLPGESKGQIIPGVVANHLFSINADVTIPIHTDPLIQSALAADGLITQTVDELSEVTKRWLSGAGIGEILAIALRTFPEHEPTSVLVAADQRGRHWPLNVLPAFGLLVTQMAWSRRYLTLTAHLQSQQQELERLNWYKNRLIEDFHRIVEAGVKNLAQLDAKEVNILQARTKQISQQLGNSLVPIAQMLEREQWELLPMGDLGGAASVTISLTSLLKRSLDRVEPLIKQRRLWYQVHDAGGEPPIPKQLNIKGNLIKIELVLYEVLVAACYRAPETGRIDIWYRLVVQQQESEKTTITRHFLDLSITDNGVIDSRLVEELQHSPWDELAPSILNQPPGRHLLICQSLIHQMGGEFHLYPIDDGRVLSRLVLPLAAL